MLSLHFDIVESTNIIAKQLLSSHNDVIITADVQTNGKGRNGKTWHSGIGRDILFSHGQKYILNSEKTPLLMQACAGLSVQAFLLNILPSSVQIKIKYPNDIYIKHKDKIGKISGSLIETEYSGSNLISIITGIGINVNSPTNELPNVNPSISILDILGHEIDLQKCRKEFVDIYKALINDRDDKLNLWKNQLNIIQKTIHILNDNQEYIVIDILEDGRLHCKSGDSERYIHSGDSITYALFD
jgi:BirA family biotin operon repressor/biotin-[acetyl-CoA-carboxylase] ligase